MTRQRDLEFSDVVRARLPADPRGAACRSATARPATAAPSAARSAISIRRPNWSTVARAHDATVTVAGPNGRREIPFAEFPVAYMTPAIELNEIVIAISLPALAGRPRLRLRRVLAPPRRLRHRVGGGAAGGRCGRQDHPRLGDARRHRARRRSAPREVEQALVGQAPSGDLFRDGLRKLPQVRRARRHPRAGLLPPASRHGAVAPRARSTRGCAAPNHATRRIRAAIMSETRNDRADRQRQALRRGRRGPADAGRFPAPPASVSPARISAASTASAAPAPSCSTAARRAPA